MKKLIILFLLIFTFTQAYSQWSPIGGGMNSHVIALTVYQGSLIAGGDFTVAGGNNANRIAQWNGSSWTSLGTGIDPGFYGQVNALAVQFLDTLNLSELF